MTNLFTKYRFTPEQKKATQERAIATIEILRKITDGGINNHRISQQKSKLKLIQKEGGFYAVK
jgi:hypothetical protein